MPQPCGCNGSLLRRCVIAFFWKSPQRNWLHRKSPQRTVAAEVSTMMTHCRRWSRAAPQLGAQPHQSTSSCLDGLDPGDWLMESPTDHPGDCPMESPTHHPGNHLMERPSNHPMESPTDHPGNHLHPVVSAILILVHLRALSNFNSV